MIHKLNLLRPIYLIVLIFVVSNCSKEKESELVLATFDGGEVEISEYIDHYLLSTKHKPDVLPTKENYLEIVSNKAIEKIALYNAKDTRLDSSSNFLQKLTRSQNKVLYYKYMRKEIINAVITDSLIERFYSEYSPQYNMKYILRLVFENSEQEFKKAQRDSINFIYDLLQNGLSFNDAAKKYSQDMASNKKGGDLGFLIKESIGDEIIRSVLDTLNDFTYSKPFLGVAGYYILFKGENRKVSAPNFEEIRNKIWQTLYRTRRHNIKEKAKSRFNTITSIYSYNENSKIIDIISNQSMGTKIGKPFEYKNLPITLLIEPVATYLDDTLFVKDIYEDKKKRPMDEHDFRLRVDAIAQEILFSLHARELNIHKETDVHNELQNIYNTLLRNELFHHEIEIKADEKISLMSDEDLKQLSRFELRRLHLDTENEFRQLLEADLKKRYNFVINYRVINDAMKIASDKKALQNAEMKVK